MSNIIDEFINDNKILNRVKVEDYLSVYLELRPCSFFTIPAELPNANEIGRKIDEECRQDLILIMGTRDLGLRGEMIIKLRNKIRKLMKKYVFKSEIFKAHERWAKILDLKMKIEEVRPSIYEVFLYRDSSIGKRLKKLFKIRHDIRKAILRLKPLTLPPSLLVYPEELSKIYVTELGELLGYPKCCIERYAEDRNSNIYVEERASKQIRELKLSGGSPNIYAYFVNGFIPCSPTCSNAIAKGKEIYEALNKLNPKAGEFYLKCLKSNMNIVENYPQLISKYRREINSRAKSLLSFM